MNGKLRRSVMKYFTRRIRTDRGYSLKRGGHWHWDHTVGLGWWVYVSTHGRKKPKKELMSIRQKRLKRERFR